MERRRPHFLSNLVNRARVEVAARAFAGALVLAPVMPVEAKVAAAQEVVDPEPFVNQQEVEGKEKEVRIGQYNSLLLRFLSQQGVDNLKNQGFINESEMKVLKVETKESESYVFYTQEGNQRIRKGVFEYPKDEGGEIRRQAYVPMNIKGEDRLEEATEYTQTLLREQTEFKKGGFVDEEELEGSYISGGGNLRQTIINFAVLPSGIIKDDELGENFTEERRVVVNSDKGYIAFNQSLIPVNRDPNLAKARRAA